MKTLFLIAALSFSFGQFAAAQILCIYCYDQNDSISSGVTNLIQNGSFENHNCTPNTNGSSYCPNSINYNCTVTDWTCTGGGLYTYASMWTNALTVVPDGLVAPYFGNDFCMICSGSLGDTSCLENVDCGVTGIPTGYPINASYYGGTEGISLSQTVSGLTVNSTYVLEFWCGGEDFGSFVNWGVFAVDVGFGDTMLRCRATNPGKIGKRYIIEFNATSSSQTIKFTNWGHICYECTELILDNVRLYPIDQLDASVPVCASPNSAPSFASSDSAVCEKFCISFFDSSANNPTAWLWQFEGGTPSFSTAQNPTNICYDVPGVYDVTLITTNANGNDTTTLNDYITVHDTPAFPTIAQIGYTLLASAAATYQWQLNATDIPGATDQTYDVLQTGFYTVIISDGNGCKNSSTLYVQITGIAGIFSNANCAIYPNPSSGSFTVELQHAEDAGAVTLNIVNTIGQVVYSSNEIISVNDWKKEIVLQATPGIYFVDIKMEDVFVRRMIVIN